MRRWFVAAAALVLGGGMAALLLASSNPNAGTQDVFVAARDLPAGTQLVPDAVRLAPVKLGGAAQLAFDATTASKLYSLRATHDLMAGQVIQRSDAALGKEADARVVLVPVRSAPPLVAGSRIDLLAVTGPPDHPVLIPFAAGLLVSAQAGGSLVIAVDAQQASALAYAALTVPLVAVLTSGSAGGEQPVATVEQAEDLVRR